MTYETFEALGFINDRGDLEMNDDEGMLQVMRQFPRRKSVLVKVSVLRESRSSAQNRFWHGIVIPHFAEHCGYDLHEMKDALALQLIPREVIDLSTGEVRTVPGHTSSLNTKEFADLIDRAIRLGAEMGVVIPEPGENVR